MILCANCKWYDHMCFGKVRAHSLKGHLSCTPVSSCECVNAVCQSQHDVSGLATCLSGWQGHFLIWQIIYAEDTVTNDSQRSQPPPHFCQDWVSHMTRSVFCSETDGAARCGKWRQCGSPLNFFNTGHSFYVPPPKVFLSQSVSRSGSGYSVFVSLV